MRRIWRSLNGSISSLTVPNPNYKCRNVIKLSQGFGTVHANNPRSFDEIPEAKGLPYIGTLLDYTPLRGFDVCRIYELWKRRHDQLGDLYKEKIRWKYWVFCRTKEDTEKLFRVEGRLPYRVNLEGLTFIKESMGYPESIANQKGTAWLQARQQLNNLMLKNKIVWKSTVEQSQVCDSLVQYIITNRDVDLEVPNFSQLLDAWAFEIASIFLFNSRLGLLDDDPSEEYLEGFNASRKLLQFIGRLSSGPFFWKYLGVKDIRDTAVRFQNILIKLIEEQQENYDLSDTLLGGLLDAPNLSKLSKESLIFDVLLGSTETTANSSALILYCLATNEAVQRKLRAEILSLPEEKRSDGRALGQLRYLNALLKEAHRLYPFNHALPRVFEHEIVLSGYRIPAGTQVLNTINSTMNRNSDYFANPNECIPERWLDSRDDKFKTTGGFGVGARACPGRFFAKQELTLLLVAILSNFEIEYRYDPACSLAKTTGVLSEEPRFTFHSL